MNGIRTINGQYPDDNRDFDINAGRGIEITPATGGITIENLVYSNLNAGDNIEITTNDDDIEIALVSNPVINGDIQINGDIIQNGSAYETHAEQVFTTKDYVIMRDGAISALSAGDYSGFQVKKYDGTNDGRLVIDKDGIARVGDVGDEQPLLTRDETDDMTNGRPIIWDAYNNKGVTATKRYGAIYSGTATIQTTGWNTGISPYPTKYPYHYEIGVSIPQGYNYYPIIAFNPENTDNSIFAPVCDCTNNGTLRIYASAIPSDTADISFTITEMI